MATVRVNIPNQNNKDAMTFKEFKANLREQWKNKPEVSERHKTIAQSLPRILLMLQAPSQLYMFLYHIIPRLFEEYDEMTQTCLKLVTCYCCAQGLLNYCLTVFTDSTLKKTNESEQHSQKYTNGHIRNGITTARDDGELQWSFCDKCNMSVPPRAHHCKVCKKCILKRDHHCFMVGTCIGFYNQRYFFVLGFYAIICGLVAFAFNVYFLYLFYWPTAYSWTSYIPPVGIFRWLFGYEEIQTHVIILICHAYPQLFFGLFGFVVVNANMTMCVLGKTAHEITAKIAIKSNISIAENFESVFGKFWMLNFVFPLLCIRQPGDGIHWPGVKIEHNEGTKEHSEGANNNHVTIDM